MESNRIRVLSLANSMKLLLSLATVSVLIALVIFVGIIPSALSQEQEEQRMQVAMAYGYIANNQLQNGTVMWIQGGSWRMELFNTTDGDNNNNTVNGNFSASFTMVKPDGNSAHPHSIKNFTSDMVVLEGGDAVMTGVAEIYLEDTLQYARVPIIVHVMGKNALGLTIDRNSTENHFASSNEMYGTVTSSYGIEDRMQEDRNGMNMDMNMNMTASNPTSSTSATEGFDFTGVKVTDVTANSAMVEGTTTVPVRCQVEYGSSTNKMDKIASDEDMRMVSPHRNHSVMLRNLEPDTVYNYRLNATVNDAIFYSEIKTFTTTG